MANQNLNFTITAKDLTRGTFRKLNQSLGLVRKALFNFKVGLTAVAGAAGIGLLVKSSLQSIDTLGKTAQKLGVTSQALQKLRYASNLAGVETRTVDLAVQRFTRRLSEAANGTGEAKDALKELGLNAKELAKQPLDKQMLALADAFANVDDAGTQVRLGFKLFDSEAVGMINTLKGGSAALQQMFQEAEGLGFILSKSAVRGVEQANDAFMKLKTMLGGVINQLVAGLAPAFQAIAETIRVKLVNAIKEAGGVEEFGRSLALTVVGLFKKAAQAIQSFTDETIRQLNRVIAFSVEIGKKLDIDWAKKLEPMNVKDLGLVGAFEELEAKIRATQAANDIFGQSTETNSEKTKTYRKQLMDLADSAKDLQKNMEAAAVRGIKSLEDALVDVTMGTASAKDAFKSMARSIISDLIRIQIQQSITAPLASAMGGGGGTGIAASVGKFFGGFFANGGRPPRNKVSVVGERGAELFVPDGVSGTVVPSGSGGGVTVHQTINLSAGVSQTVRAEVIGMLPQIQEASKAAVLEARRRGGSFASAFGA